MLRDMHVDNLAHETRVTFTLSSATQFRTFTLQHPNRFIVDLKNVKTFQRLHFKNLRYATHPDGVFRMVFILHAGVKAAAKRGSRFDKTSSIVLFMLYSMPSFWLATLLLMTFANTDALNWFPASGVKPAIGYPDAAEFFEKVKISLPYIILPAICYTYSSFAFLSRTMRVSMIEIVGQDYIRTARAKGLPENKVIWKHAFRNSLLPIITVFANIFPAAIGGSVIIESIFTIPGMGSESIFAIQNNNYPMIIAVLTITGFLTLVGYLVSDILYAIVDPRISYK